MNSLFSDAALNPSNTMSSGGGLEGRGGGGFGGGLLNNQQQTPGGGGYQGLFNNSNPTMMNISPSLNNNWNDGIAHQQSQVSRGSAPSRNSCGGGGGDTLLKTPVSLLNEVCAKAKMVPRFETVDDGPPHDKVFQCTVRLEKEGGVWEGKGVAKSKKDARQEAAKALLLSMDENADKLLVPVKDKPKEEALQEPQLQIDPEPEGNPVAELNEMCLKLKRPLPDYEEVGEEGRPHERVYTISCKLGTQIEEVGKAKTKKNAKKVAAFKAKVKLMEIVKNAMPMEEDVTDGGGATGDILDKLVKLTVDPKASFKASEWLEGFQKRTGEKWGTLGGLNITSELTSSTASPQVGGACPIKLLREIAEEQTFKVEYVDLKSADNSSFSAIIIIGVEPIAIFHGTSTSSKTQARKQAALRAVEFFQVVTSSHKGPG